MIHFVHVVRPMDGKQAAAIGELLVLLVIGWLVWNYVPEGWAMATAWLPEGLATVSGWLHNILRIFTVMQALLLPVWALLVGFAFYRNGSVAGAVLWLGMVGLYAVCTALLGYYAFAGIAFLGSLAALRAVAGTQGPVRGWTGWLMAAVAVGMSAWGLARYGLTLGFNYWPLLPVSWVCLGLAAVFRMRSRAFSSWSDRDSAKLILLAVALFVATAAPFAPNAARSAGLLPQVPVPGSVQPVSVSVPHAPVHQGPAKAVVPSRQSGSSVGPGGGQGGKPASSRPPAHSQT